MKKKLNIEGIQNELTGNSSFFREAREKKEGRAVAPKKTSTKALADTHERTKKKMTIDLYTDQYVSLINIKTKLMMDGENKSLVDFIRDAVDDFIAKNS